MGFFLSPSPTPPPALHSPHFPFTLLQSPGENSPSCQCNVAHRGNHAAPLASGAGENATLALNHRMRQSMGRFSAHYGTGDPCWWARCGCECCGMPGPPCPSAFSRFPIGGGVAGRPALIRQFCPRGKRAQLDARQPAETLWIHESHLLTAIRGTLV